MWKLMVKRNYMTASGYEAIDKMYFESEVLEELLTIIYSFKTFGIGNFEYLINYEYQNQKAEDNEDEI